MDKIEAKVSFTILTHNEEDSLKKLLDQLISVKSISDEIIIVDDYSSNPKTLEVLDWAKTQIGCRIFQNRLDGDFASQKNFAAEKCTNEFIFNIDADELMDERLASSYKEILALNADVDLFLIPRVNKVKDMTLSHIQQWRWQIGSIRTEIEDKPLTQDSDEYKFIKAFNLIIHEDGGMIKFYTPIINWPDWQGRIYKNNDKIYWVNKVHEVIAGHKKFAKFPQDKKFSLLHYKDIQTQEQQNSFYTTIRR